MSSANAAAANPILHAVTGGVGPGTWDPFFEEGIAEALQGGHIRMPRRLSKPSQNLDRSTSDAIDYDTAGHFMRWLLEEHGAANIRALLDGRDFADVYDESLQSAEQRWMTTAPWLYPAHEPCPFEPLPYGRDGWHDTFELDCEDYDVRSGASQEIGTCRTFDIELEGLYTYASNARTWIERCQHDVIEEPSAVDREAVPAAHNYNRPLKFFAPGQEHEALFRVGQHMLCVSSDGTHEPTPVQISLAPTETTLVRP